MASHQMSPELVQLIKGTVNWFNISSETYYHAVLLFNVIQLKKNSELQSEYFTIPVKKRNYYQSSDSGSDDENENFTDSETEFIRVHHTQMPQSNKLDFAVCLFLVHKLYEPYPLCLSYLMRHMEIDEQFQEYIISLEKEFLVKLAYKIENQLPSNETIFACHLWDDFIQNIDSTCIDVRFGINEIFQCSRKKIRTSHQINRNNIQPEFKTIQTQKSFDALSHNIQILVHNRAVYELYLKKAAEQSHEDISSMKKMSLAITYVTIFQQTNMTFNKKYPLNLKGKSEQRSQKNQYLEFVFNDFLDEHFGINLNHLVEEIDLVYSILQENKEKVHQKSPNQNKKIPSIKIIEETKSNEFVNFILRAKQKQTVHEHHYKYHTKCKANFSISSTKTNKESEERQSFYIKGKCSSILRKKSLNDKNKHLESTLHQSNISEKASNFRRSISTKKSGKLKKENLEQMKGIYGKKMQKSLQGFGNSHQRSLILSTRNSSSIRHENSITHSNKNQETHEKHYKVSPFVPIDV